jgi:hypothetical protein
MAALLAESWPCLPRRRLTAVPVATGGQTTRLLNEIAAAQVCLNDRAKRVEYDAELKRKKPQEAGTVLGTPLRSIHVVQPRAGSRAFHSVPPAARGQPPVRGGSVSGAGVGPLDDLLAAAPPKGLRPPPRGKPSYHWQVLLAFGVVGVVALIVIAPRVMSALRSRSDGKLVKIDAEELDAQPTAPVRTPTFDPPKSKP